MTDKHFEIFEVLWGVTENTPKVANARIAAAVVLKGEIISIGINQKKSHPFQKKYSKNEDSIFLHAENSAILGALRYEEDLYRAELFVLRRKTLRLGRYSKDTWGLAKPCVGCQKAISVYGISKVYFSLDGKGNYDELS